MAKFLVTGGGGFIGSHLVQAVLERGDGAVVLDDFSSGRRENLAEAKKWSAGAGGRMELIEGDIRDRETCRRAMEGVDHVLHKAAIPSVQRSVQDPLSTNAVNVSGTLNLLQAAREAGVRRFVFASSSSIYGESETLPKVETMPSEPISPYGLQKLAGETYVRLYHRLYGVPTIALRYFNVFGPRQDPTSEYSAVIPKFLAAAREGRTATIYGDGEQTRDFTYVANVVRANLAACAAPVATCGEAYNIACGERISLNELVRVIGELSGRGLDVRHDPARPGDIKHSLAGVERAIAALDYRAEVDLREGLRRAYEGA